MSDEEENFYIEFSIEGVMRIKKSEKKSAINEIKRLLNKAMGTRDVIRIESNVNVVSENDIMFAMNSNSTFN